VSGPGRYIAVGFCGQIIGTKGCGDAERQGRVSQRSSKPEYVLVSAYIAAERGPELRPGGDSCGEAG
jgi:hypothetical protein